MAIDRSQRIVFEGVAELDEEIRSDYGDELQGQGVMGRTVGD
jgi:hypothetical protein